MIAEERLLLTFPPLGHVVGDPFRRGNVLGFAEEGIAAHASGLRFHHLHELPPDPRVGSVVEEVALLVAEEEQDVGTLRRIPSSVPGPKE